MQRRRCAALTDMDEKAQRRWRFLGDLAEF